MISDYIEGRANAEQTLRGGLLGMVHAVIERLMAGATPEQVMAELSNGPETKGG